MLFRDHFRWPACLPLTVPTLCPLAACASAETARGLPNARRFGRSSPFTVRVKDVGV